jgi:hypothetical protein
VIVQPHELIWWDMKGLYREIKYSKALNCFFEATEIVVHWRSFERKKLFVRNFELTFEEI